MSDPTAWSRAKVGVTVQFVSDADALRWLQMALDSASSPGAAAETEKPDKKLNLHVWQVDHGWAAAVYTGDGSIPGSVCRAASAYSSPDDAVTAALDWLKTRLARAVETEPSG